MEFNSKLLFTIVDLYSMREGEQFQIGSCWFHGLGRPESVLFALQSAFCDSQGYGPRGTEKSPLAEVFGANVISALQRRGEEVRLGPIGLDPAIRYSLRIDNDDRQVWVRIDVYPHSEDGLGLGGDGQMLFCVTLKELIQNCMDQVDELLEGGE